MLVPTRLLSALVALALLATACGGGTDTATVETASESEGAAPATAPEPTATLVPIASGPAVASGASSPSDAQIVSTIGGGEIDFASFEGRDVVLWFWAPW